MNFMIFGIPVHFCPVEGAMLIVMLSSIGGMWAWVKSKFKKDKISHHKCCHPFDKH